MQTQRVRFPPAALAPHDYGYAMNAVDIVKLVRKLRDDPLAEEKLRACLSDKKDDDYALSDYEWAYRGWKMLRAGFGWPERQRGTPDPNYKPWVATPGWLHPRKADPTFRKSKLFPQ